MKNILNIITFCFVLLFTKENISAQPLWQRTISITSDTSSSLAAVKVLVDNAEQIYVLSNYSSPIAGSIQERKILLNKYNSSGILQWSYTFDNQSLNNVRAYDMRIDGSNNVYIAGGRIINNQFSLLFFKVSMNGNLSWVKFGNTGFDVDYYTNIEFRNNLFYLRSNAGVAVYNENGIEQYVVSQYNSAFDVDYSGRIVLSGYLFESNLIRYTNTGSIDFVDSTMQADKILCDYNNEIFLVSGQNGMTSYGLAKHNSDGNFKWSIPGLPITPPFGDWNYGIMATGQNEYVLYGVNDSLIKFNTAGEILWKKHMGGMDDAQLSGKILGNGFLLFTGSINGFAGSDVVTKIFNTNGIEVWSQLFNGTFTGGDFGVDVDANNDGIYVISQLEDSTNFMKYLSPASQNEIDFTQVCVDSVWIDSTGFVHINIYNGNFANLNYPSVVILSPTGDTISLGTVNFFAQLGNTYQEYINSISDTTISNFENYNFFINNTFNPDTLAQVDFCIPTKINESVEISFTLFPNPVNDCVTIQLSNQSTMFNLSINDIMGKEVFHKSDLNSTQKINCENFSNGIYLLKISDGVKSSSSKLIVNH
jgi:hypothetical protein